MQTTRIIMGMPITLVAVDDQPATEQLFERAFKLFEQFDEKYSPYKETSLVAKINRQELDTSDYDDELQEIEAWAEQAKQETHGYFNVWHKGAYDPSGIVKGWAIDKVARMMSQSTNDFYIDAGGDIQTNGRRKDGQAWRIGIRNPFNRDENIAVLGLSGQAVATSGTAIRGQHIYNPLADGPIKSNLSLSVIAPNIIDADRMATAAFAMGHDGINFIERLDGYEAYLVDDQGIATQTTGWQKYEV